jgi:curved DNA-binding protein CbpA
MAPPEGPLVTNYYEILEVTQSAGLAEIKKSFRRLLKRLHPDRNRANSDWAEAQTRRLVDAYHVLCDEQRRRHHDHELRLQGFQVHRRNGAPRGPRPTFGIALDCRRILDRLLEGNGTQAVEDYEKLRGERSSFDFYPHLSLKDHLDCKFLLGEEYEQQGKLADALLLYEEVYREERDGPRLRYFFEDVQERIVIIYCQQLLLEPSAEDAMACFNEAMKLDLPAKDVAEIQKKLADGLLRLGDEEGARRELTEALRIRPGLKGVQRLCSRLGIRACVV